MNPKFIELLKGLLEATDTGRIRWERTVGTRDFRVQFDGPIVRVGETSRLDSTDYEDTTTYATLIGPKGETLEYATAENLPPQIPTLIPELYRAARRQALNVDNLIDQLLKRVSHVPTS